MLLFWTSTAVPTMALGLSDPLGNTTISSKPSPVKSPASTARRPEPLDGTAISPIIPEATVPVLLSRSLLQKLILPVHVERHRHVERGVRTTWPRPRRAEKSEPEPSFSERRTTFACGSAEFCRREEPVGALIAEHDIVGAQDVRPPEQHVVNVFETRLGGVGTASVTGIPEQRLGWIHERRFGKLHRVLGCGRAPEHSGRVHDADAEQNDHERYGSGAFHIRLLLLLLLARRGGCPGDPKVHGARRHAVAALPVQSGRNWTATTSS